MVIHSRLTNVVPVVFVLLWSTGFIGAKYALPYIEPFFLLCIRMSITVCLFFALCLVFKVEWPNLSQIRHQMVSGALIHGFYLGAVFAAIKWDMPAGITAIVVGLQPILTAFIAWMWMGNRLTATQWLGLMIGFIGMTAVVVLTSCDGSYEFNWLALSASLVALVSISVGTLYQKRFGGGVSLLAGSFWQYVSTAILMAVLAWSFETREVVWHPQLIMALLWLIFGLSLSAVLLLMYMIREGEATKVVSYFYLVAPVVSVEAWLLFGEKLTLWSIVAMVITVFGVYLVVKKTK
ncbi:MAG: drug/metabolite transporter (DMT)-like permease [Saprospiraceae bacterium]|jgi:drug/metabolite transporter (DMT)-like permease